MEAIDMGLFVTISSVLVAGLAAVLGIWMERDKNKPPRYAWALSALIVMTTLVSLAQSWLDEAEENQLQDDMARLLVTMDKLATESGDADLAALLKQELSAQSRSNPDVVERVAQRVSDDGRDPSAMLEKHLDEAEVEKVARGGSIKPKSRPKKEEPAPAPEPAAAPARAGRVPAAATAPAAGEGEPAAVPTSAPLPSGAPARAGRVAPTSEGEPAPEPAAAVMPTAAPAPEPEPVSAPSPTAEKGGKKGRAKPGRKR